MEFVDGVIVLHGSEEKAHIRPENFTTCSKWDARSANGGMGIAFSHIQPYTIAFNFNLNRRRSRRKNSRIGNGIWLYKHVQKFTSLAIRTD